MQSGTLKPFRLGRALSAAVLLAGLLGESFSARSQQGAPNPAISPASQSSVRRPQPWATPEEIGDSMLVQRRYHEAVEIYSKIPNPSPDVWNKMGVSYQVMLDVKDAMRCYRESLRLRPSSARVLNNLGSVYDSLGDHARAERQYREALKLDPTFPQAAMNLGTNLMMQNRYRDGMEMYRRAAALDPDILDGVDATLTAANVLPEQKGAINYDMARAFSQAGKTGRAVKYLRQAIDEGFATPETIAREGSFTGLRGIPAFDRLMAKQQER
jgi:tetratricopeptide (TPR) repeat protein